MSVNAVLIVLWPLRYFYFQGRPLREIPTVKIAVRFTYVIKNDFDEDWPQELPDVTSEFGSETGYSNLSGLPFGPFQEPVRWESLCPFYI